MMSAGVFIHSRKARHRQETSAPTTSENATESMIAFTA